MSLALAAGTRLGAYTVHSALGAGGMGEVYRATDTRLNRDVALKILPDLFAHDADRLARFQREAEVLASLNHPNIAAIHGIEESGGIKALVLELVDGPTLSDRIAGGPIPVAEVIPIARQIAEALEAAHEHGIVHRDLKPSNVKLRPDGAVKVLDFGLAKTTDPARSRTELTQSPTLMSPAATQAGLIMGTAAYMSPEQAKGRPVDKRADIWAFGCVLFEMLTGARAFEGDDVSDTMAAILRGEPDWSRLPADTPRALVKLVKRCLHKDRRGRLHDVGDARLELEDAADAPSDAPAIAAAGRQPMWPRVLPIAAATLAAGLLAASAAWTLKPGAPVQQRQFLISLPPGEAYSTPGRNLLALSPRGTHLVYVANGRLNLRALDELEPVPIRGTDGVGDGASRGPFFSPDGRWVAFWQTGQLKRISLDGGSSVTIADMRTPFGASWNDDDTILYGLGPEGIWKVPATGGTPERVIAVSEGEFAYGPQLLPDGEHVLFTLRPKGTTDWNDAHIVVQSLRSGERRTVVERGRDGRYVPSGHLLYVLRGTLFATRFDAGRLAVRGGAASLIEGIPDAGGQSGAVHYAIAQDGSLAYVRSGETAGRATPVWVDRTGRELQQLTQAPIAGLTYPRLSPDGRRFAAIAGGDLWVHDLEGRPPIKLTAVGGLYSPVWSPDGTRIVYESSTPSGLMSIAADGTSMAERVSPEGHFHPMVVLENGDVITISLDPDQVGIVTGSDIVRMSPKADGKPEPVVVTANREGFEGTSLSPDGRWLAYVSDITGVPEVWVQPYPGPGAPRRVSPNGGIEPVWSRNGRELYYLEGRKMMAVAVDASRDFSFKAPKQLFETASLTMSQPPSYDVSADGRFLMLKPTDGQAAAPPIVLALNWFEELKRRLP